MSWRQTVKGDLAVKGALKLKQKRKKKERKEGKNVRMHGADHVITIND